MATHPAIAIIEQVVKILRYINEPVSIERFLILNKIPLKDSEELQTKVKNILETAIKLDLVTCYKDQYFSTHHADDMLPFLETDSQLSLTESLQYFESISSEPSTSEEDAKKEDDEKEADEKEADGKEAAGKDADKASSSKAQKK